MTGLNGMWLDTYILQIITHQELQKLTKILQENLILKIQNFWLKLETFTNLKEEF